LLPLPVPEDPPDEPPLLEADALPGAPLMPVPVVSPVVPPAASVPMEPEPPVVVPIAPPLDEVVPDAPVPPVVPELPLVPVVLPVLVVPLVPVPVWPVPFVPVVPVVPVVPPVVPVDCATAMEPTKTVAAAVTINVIRFMSILLPIGSHRKAPLLAWFLCPNLVYLEFSVE
jgi:hypothetical protein